MRKQGLAGLLATAFASACVRVDPGPNGVASARLAAIAPSIVVGDQLRDSLGVVTTLGALVFDESGQLVATAPLRFAYVPTARDSLQRPIPDTALVVDSITGAVRATSPLTLARGVVAVRVGDRLQLVDTLEIVSRPDSAAADTGTVPPVRFDCTDLRTALDTSQGRADTLFRNASAVFGLTVRGDSAGQRGARTVRSRLVRWSVVSPTNLPPVRLPGGAPSDTVPTLSIIDGAADVRIRFDTTDASGRSTVRLRIRPSGLGNTTVPARAFTVRLRADVQPGNAPVRNSPLFVDVPLLRRSVPPLPGLPVTCQ